MLRSNLFEDSRMSHAPKHLQTGIHFLVVCLLLVAGCATNKISRPNQWALGADGGSKTVWTFFWGACQQNINPTNCVGPGLSEVTVHGNFGYSLISVLSLGTAMPVTIEWRCAKDKPTGGGGF